MIERMKRKLMNIASVVTKKISGEHVTGLMVKSKGLSFLVMPDGQALSINLL